LRAEVGAARLAAQGGLELGDARLQPRDLVS
jgi:hypothetical protein